MAALIFGARPTWGAALGIRRSFLPAIFSQYTSPLGLQQQQQQLPRHQSNPNHRLYSSSTSDTMASKQFLDILKTRRTIYTLKKESTISDTKIQEIIKEIILHTPSSFNSQSTRVVLLVKEEHDKLWEITKDAIKAIVPAEAWPASEQRLNGFKAAYGTALFFEDRTTVQGMQQKFAIYADKFPGWAAQSDGMSQYALWTALELEGLGANLQHYNPLIDQKVQETWGIDKDWVLNAQLVFGTPSAPAGDKTFLPVEDRFKVFGA